MFQNAFVKSLTILHPDGGTTETSAIITKEEFSRVDGTSLDTSSAMTFVLEDNLSIDVYDKLSYNNCIFEIKSISLIESLDRQKIYYKIKVK